ncbi:hypothetical protein [Methylobacterium dankookense]|nr:hypothetical protein [Methylobacterium dankookense]
MRIKQGGTLTFISGFMSERPQASARLQSAFNAALESLDRRIRA